MVSSFVAIGYTNLEVALRKLNKILVANNNYLKLCSICSLSRII